MSVRPILFLYLKRLNLISGGEPLITKVNYRFLKFLLDNNLTHITIVASGGTITNASYEYTYDTAGYPTKVIITDEDGGTYSQNFFYTRK